MLITISVIGIPITIEHYVVCCQSLILVSILPIRQTLSRSAGYILCNVIYTIHSTSTRCIYTWLCIRCNTTVFL